VCHNSFSILPYPTVDECGNFGQSAFFTAARISPFDEHFDGSAASLLDVAVILFPARRLTEPLIVAFLPKFLAS